MFFRSMLAAGLFFQLTIALEAQFLQQQRNVPMTPEMQQRLRAQGMQTQPGMQQGMQGMQQPMPFDTSGTIDAFAGQRLQITEANGNKRVIVLNQQTTIQTTGEATVDFLRAGLTVEFKAEGDGKGNLTGKVEELSITSVTKENPAGVFPEGGSAGDSGKKGVATAKKGAAVPAGMNKIIGQIKSVKSGKYQVQAGRATLLFELSENPKITVETADGQYAGPGDKVEISGIMIPNSTVPGQAKTVKITLTNPLEGEKKKSSSAKLDPKHPPKALKSKKGNAEEGLPPLVEEK